MTKKNTHLLFDSDYLSARYLFEGVNAETLTQTVLTSHERAAGGEPVSVSLCPVLRGG